MEKYIYDPLVHDDQIRILTLMPGYGQDRIQGTINCIRLSLFQGPSAEASESVWTWGHKKMGEERLFINVKRDSHPTSIREIYSFECNRTKYTPRSYDALSYTWGNPEQVEEIVVSGKWLGVARNLHAGLLRLRHPKEPRRLWIDAICINQSDNNERNHQVKMMQRVYSVASSVIVWLGEPEHDVALTLEAILDFNNELRSRSRWSTFSKKPSIVRGLVKLLQNSWWRRIWIVQEVVAAQELVFLLGNITFPWVYMRKVCSAVQPKTFFTTLTELSLLLITESCGYRGFEDLDSFRAAGSMPLLRLLRSTQQYQATDPRDKLYALLGITSDLSVRDLVPDYNKSVLEVFQDLIQFMAVRRKNLDLICLTQSQRTSNIWIPRSIPSCEGAIVDMTRFPRVLFAEGVVVDTVILSRGSTTIEHELKSLIARGHSEFCLALEGQQDHSRIGASEYLSLLKSIASNEHCKECVEHNGFGPVIQIPGDAHLRKARRKCKTSVRVVMKRRFFTTKKGRIGLAPVEVHKNDSVVVLKGCHVPLVVRAGRDQWSIVAEAYVSDIMFGEIMAGVKDGRYKTIMIPLK